MPKPSPATISYEVEGKETKIKFHAVISEAHDLNATVTKFPVQSGFKVSNHTILDNRKIKIKGVVTNTILEGSGMTQYSKVNNSKEMFKVLQSLIRSSVVCKVASNLGIYDPVVFTNIKAEQKVGTVDSLEFTLMGEEVQVAGLSGRSAPVLLTMSLVTPRDKDRLALSFKEAGLPFDKNMIIHTTQVNLGTDFSMLVRDPSGKVTVTTYECVGYEHGTQVYTYKAHTTIEEMFSDGYSLSSWAGSAVSEVTGAVGGTLPSNSFMSGVRGASSCLLDKTEELLFGIGEDLLDEHVLGPFGEMVDSVFGKVQEYATVGGTSIGQTILGFGLDCVSSEIGKAYGLEGVDSTEDLGKAIRTETEKELDKTVDMVKGKGKELVKASRSKLPEIPDFPLVETTITQISNPIKGALSKLGELREDILG